MATASNPRQTAEWQRAKKQAKRRDQYRCQHCDRREGKWGTDLQVHHIRPVEKGGSNDLDNLATLCNDCHGTLHRHYDDEERLTVDLLEEERTSIGRVSSRRDSFDTSDCHEQILELLHSQGPTQLKDIIEATGYARGTVQHELKGLMIGGFVCRISRGVYGYITELEYWRMEERESDEHGRIKVRVWNPGEQVDLEHFVEDPREEAGDGNQE